MRASPACPLVGGIRRRRTDHACFHLELIVKFGKKSSKIRKKKWCFTWFLLLLAKRLMQTLGNRHIYQLFSASTFVLVQETLPPSPWWCHKHAKTWLAQGNNHVLDPHVKQIVAILILSLTFARGCDESLTLVCLYFICTRQTCLQRHLQTRRSIFLDPHWLMESPHICTFFLKKSLKIYALRNSLVSENKRKCWKWSQTDRHLRRKKSRGTSENFVTAPETSLNCSYW